MTGTKDGANPRSGRATVARINVARAERCEMAKFNEKTTTQILTAMRLGSPLERAAQAAGVDRTRLWRWVKKGEADARDGRRTRYAVFYREFNKAEAEVVGLVEQHIVEASAADWRAGACWLQKRAPGTFGDTDPTERLAMQKAMVTELFDFLKGHLSPGAFEEVRTALVNWGDEGLDAKALPCPG